MWGLKEECFWYCWLNIQQKTLGKLGKTKMKQISRKELSDNIVRRSRRGTSTERFFLLLLKKKLQKEVKCFFFVSFRTFSKRKKVNWSITGLNKIVLRVILECTEFFGPIQAERDLFKLKYKFTTVSFFNFGVKRITS